ncbi:hypothetical protein DPMN_092303 [Dreissena polymorpha]|uniref:DJ-1/PfpI domain-containing protein n=1 Tax=Dreissena polymorpha TaxID=45954 RepID=A0A9D4R014_DREPO|nr:hypothetical protein DPMN_092303 [Dreissena polymorpha]
MATKKIGILTEFNYEDIELWYPYYRLKEEGHETFTVGPEKGKTYNSKNGYPCKAEYGIDEIQVTAVQLWCSALFALVSIMPHLF